MDDYRKALIYVQNIFAGILSETDYGYSFRYDADYCLKGDALPVSLTLPIQSEEYTSQTLFSFFDGLIPEGWMLHLVTENWKLNPADRFGLLLAACRDCIGDVSVREAEE